MESDEAADPDAPAEDFSAAPADATRAPLVRDFTYSSRDGLLLAGRDYGDPLSPWLPVVCLSGLTRNGRDFTALALHLSTDPERPRRVVTFDYRGRGRSAWDRNTDNYNPLVEMTDVFDGMAMLGIPRAVIVGTSRGGIIAMLMGVARPAALAGVVLNDVGPELEPRGLARIKTYVGRMPAPDDWNDAVAILRRLHGSQFTALSENDWMFFARTTYRDADGRPESDYDPALAGTLDGIEFDRPMPNLWDQYLALAAIPVMAIRGENSDLLSPATFAAMAARHPRFDGLTIPGEGHAPLLIGAALLQYISSFIAGIEGAGPPADAVVPKAHVPYDPDAATGGEPA